MSQKKRIEDKSDFPDLHMVPQALGPGEVVRYSNSSYATTAIQWFSTERDAAGNPVAVPDGYFKVLLKYKVSSATYYSIAFVYENRDYGRHNPVEEDLHTVSEVEEMTGFTFFNNLPQSVAASVKDQLEPNRWGF